VRRLLITGGSGYLGRELLRQAPTAGWDATGTYLAHPFPGGVPLDVRDPGAAAVVEGIVPDAVIHTAYVARGPGLWPVTAAGAAAVARGAARCGARLVHLSTDLVFSGERAGAWREDDPAEPVVEYGRAKLASEAAVAEACPGALSVRTSLIVGGREHSPHERLALDAWSEPERIALYSDEIRSVVAVADLAAALLELAASRAAGVLHVAGADAVSRLELGRLVCASRGLDPARLRGEPSPRGPGARPRNCALDSSRGRALLRVRLRGAREIFRPAPPTPPGAP
jgi:dTDP-4-dehydrorhamnose reductase